MPILIFQMKRSKRPRKPRAKMKILGIDPGLQATGYGLIEYENKKIRLLETGTIEPKPKDLLQNKLNRIYKALDTLITQFQPQVMVLEKLYAHYKHPTTACIMGHARGVICLLCASRNVELVEHSVKRIRIALSGNGNSSKEQMRRVVSHMLKLDESKLPLDASDALALALGYVHIKRLAL